MFNDSKETDLEKLKRQRSYWMNKLSDYLCENKFPYNNVINGDKEYIIEKYTVDNEMLLSLKNISGNSKRRLYVLLVSCMCILLYKNTKKNKMVIGSPILKQKEKKEYINTLIPIVADLNDDISFKELVLSINETMLEAYDNQDYPMKNIIENLKRDSKKDDLELFSINTREHSIHENCYDEELKRELNLQFSINDKNIEINVEYNSSYYVKDYIDTLINQYKNIIKVACNNPKVMLKDISLISLEEVDLILNKFNNTKTNYPSGKSVKDIFEETARENKDKIAVVSGDRSLTYGELDEKSNQIAHSLIGQGIENNDVVAILCDKSIDTIVGILGIVKVGAAYLPIDTSYPKSRVDYMVSDSKAKVLLLRQDSIDNKVVKDLPLNRIVIDSKEVLLEDKEAVNRVVSAQDLIYIIYTSGSTGKPKGVCVMNKNVVRLVKNTNYVEFKKEDRILQTGSIAFDASTFEVWGSLLNGSALYVESKDIILDSNVIKDYINKNNISVMWLTSPLFNQLCEDKVEIFSNLRYLIVGGDVVSPKYVNKVRKINDSIVIANGYGPTENTTFSTVYLIDKDVDEEKTIPIGKPISNSTAYVLDKNQNLVPIGTIGELYVGGEGVAKGYLNREDLTKEKFIENPFNKSERLYRTGDKVRLLKDGNIEFLGRIDYQVKIRGFRIELQEVERRILEHENVKEVVVLDKLDKHGSKCLAAYIVGENEIKASEIRAYLIERLPDYMIPSEFYIIEKMPLNQNGKVDRKELLLLEAKEDSSEECCKGRNEIENLLIDIWESVLVRKGIGIYNDFFTLGGDSIKIIQVLSQLRKYNYKLNVQDFFNYPTISELALHIKTIDEEIDQKLVVGKTNLTPIQEWFFNESNNEINHFNHSVMIFKEDGFDLKVLKKTCHKLIEHHDALRMTYKFENDKITGFVNDLNENSLKFKVIDLRNSDYYEDIIEQETMKEQKSVDIRKESLTRFVLFKTPIGDKLLIIVHHLVIDGVSWRILLRDLELGYSQGIKDEEITFDKKTISYKKWSEILEDYSTGEKLRREKLYWNKIVQKDIKKLPKLVDAKSDNIKDGQTITVELDKAATVDLLEKTSKAFNTEINDILLSALQISLYKWIGNGEIAINLEGHGREAIVENVELSNTIGWFTSLYPVILDLKQNDNVGYMIKNLKERLRKIPNKGVGYGILKYITAQKEESIVNLNFKPEISFNYMGQFDMNLNSDIFKIDEFLLKSSVSEEVRRNFAIDIVGIMINENIVFRFNYNKEEFDKETITSFANNYIEALKEIIDFCKSVKETEYTPSDFGDNTLTIDELNIIKDKCGKNIKKIYQLTPLQEGMVYHSLVGDESGNYVVQSVMDFKGILDENLFIKAFDLVLNKYEIFRSRIFYKNIDKIRQVILKKSEIEYVYEDISNFDLDTRKEKFDNFIEEDRQRGFDLEQDSLMRIAIFRDKTDMYKVVWSFHHVILDGWCLGIVLNDIFTFYRELKLNRNVESKESVEFGEYIKWLAEKDKEEARTYWREYLKDIKDIVGFSKLKEDNPNKPKSKNTNLFKINEELLEKLNKKASENKVTLSNIIQSIWGILLSKYCNSSDIVFGSVISGRSGDFEGIENMVGLFINTIPIRVNLNNETNFKDIVTKMQKDQVQNEKFSYYPLIKIQRDNNIETDLIDTIIAFENYPLSIDKINEELSQTDLEIDKAYSIEQTNYDFEIVIIPGKELEVSFVYNSNAYSEEFVNRVSSDMQKIIEIVSEDFSINISEINLLGNSEKEKLIKQYREEVSLNNINYTGNEEAALSEDDIDFDF
ncbi:MAG: amino acid adenylation domain-containing protein [Clostridium sp.]|nr:amino acid adenylation domain-containing protein [Clostridium sp.]